MTKNKPTPPAPQNALRRFKFMKVNFDWPNVKDELRRIVDRAAWRKWRAETR